MFLKLNAFELNMLCIAENINYFNVLVCQGRLRTFP
jgi:hypothetical protein